METFLRGFGYVGANQAKSVDWQYTSILTVIGEMHPESGMHEDYQLVDAE